MVLAELHYITRDDRIAVGLFLFFTSTFCLLRDSISLKFCSRQISSRTISRLERVSPAHRSNPVKHIVQKVYIILDSKTTRCCACLLCCDFLLFSFSIFYRFLQQSFLPGLHPIHATIPRLLGDEPQPVERNQNLI